MTWGTFGRVRKGVTVNRSEPDFGPLFNVVPEVAAAFTWVEEVELRDGTRIHAYEHRVTRGAIHLTADGEAWAFEAPDGYRRCRMYHAVMDPLIPILDAYGGIHTPAERDYWRALEMLYMERFSEDGD
jgi:hypothetical protein